jgi:hypothetical protein
LGSEELLKLLPIISDLVDVAAARGASLSISLVVKLLPRRVTATLFVAWSLRGAASNKGLAASDCSVPPLLLAAMVAPRLMIEASSGSSGLLLLLATMVGLLLVLAVVAAPTLVIEASSLLTMLIVGVIVAG